MLHSRVHIEAGDLVIVFLSRDSKLAITVQPGEFFHNKYGKYAHDDMIGMKFGSKMHSPPPNVGYVYLLRPTPELWTLSLPHRTQILYVADIAYITMKLGVRPGSTVIEAGTGSGSMTHSLSRSVGSTGRVRSFEYHKPRYEAASVEFEQHGLGNVTLQHRNVCKDGFGDATDVDSVFLDLPAPWEAIPYAVKTFRPEVIARICCFSPCLEQVLKTVSSLREEGFSDIYTQEVLIRSHEIVQPPSAGPPPFRSISSIVDGLKVHEKRKEERRVIQMRTAREKARKRKEAEAKAAGQTASAVNGDANATNPEEPGSKEEEGQGVKRKHDEVDPEEAPAQSEDASKSTDTTTEAPAPIVDQQMETSESKPKVPPTPWTDPETNLANLVLSKPSAEMRGHTSYLTFACYYPASVRSQLAAQQDESATASRATPQRVVESANAEKAASALGKVINREASQETDYGDDGLDEVMGSMTEEELMALSRR